MSLTLASGAPPGADWAVVDHGMRAVLAEAVLAEAGLTGAIVHASKILPQNRIPAEQWNGAMDLI